MAVEVLTWSIRDGFSDGKRLAGILENVEGVKPHAMVFPEAYREDETTFLDYVMERFDRSGYAVVQGLYDDDDDRLDRHGMIGVVHETVQTGERSELISLGSRMAVRLCLGDPATGETIDCFGIHLDDRGEARRFQQAWALLDHVDMDERPTIIAGKFNAMHAKDMKARALRAVRPVARRLPSIDPRPDFKPPKIRRLGSLASRLTDMADGGTMELLRDTGFHDADSRHLRTKGAFDLDHILLRGLAAVGGQITYPRLRFSDHRAVSARVRVSAEEPA